MRLWTIQDEEAYQILEQTGVLHADGNHLLDDSFRRAYDWLVHEMRLRIGEPPEGACYPIWAWYQWEGKRKRCDLRCGGYARRGTPLVQLTIDVDDDKVLLSDLDDWHYVLNFWYYSLTEEENNNFEAAYESEGFVFQDMDDPDVSDPRIEKYRQQIVASWQHIFDLWKENSYCSYPVDQKTIQATFWELRKEQIVKVEHFHAK